MMFRIPSFYHMALDFDDAVRIMTGHSTTLLDKMEDMQDKWDRHCMGQSPFDDDDEFFECFRYEVNAYNVIYREMKPLFA